MSLPSTSVLCRSIPTAPNDLCVTLPGGAQLCAQTEGLPPSLLALARSALGQASSALAPLTPLFDVIEAIAAIQDCVKAIPDALGPPPDPSGLASCIPNLASKIEKLLLLLPPASVVLTIAQLLDILIAVLEGAATELEAVAALIAKIATARELSTTVPELLSVIVCGEQTQDSMLSNLERAFASINPMIETINTIGSLAGLQPIPSFDPTISSDPTGAATTLSTAAQALRVIRDSIPV